jgi:hypothetical protein
VRQPDAAGKEAMMARNPWTTGQLVLLVVVVSFVLGLGAGFLVLSNLFAASSAALRAPSCRDQAATFLMDAGTQARTWDDADDLASQTPKRSLAPQIQGLQTLRRQAQDLDAPACAIAIKQRLVEAMDLSINGYTAFLGRQDAEAQQYFDQADRAMDDFGASIAGMQ